MHCALYTYAVRELGSEQLRGASCDNNQDRRLAIIINNRPHCGKDATARLIRNSILG